MEDSGPNLKPADGSLEQPHQPQHPLGVFVLLGEKGRIKLK